MNDKQIFIGRVNKFNDPPEKSFVTLHNVDTKEIYECFVDSQQLINIDIHNDDEEFEVILNKDDPAKPSAFLSKLEPKKISSEQIQQIIDKCKEIDFSNNEKIKYWEW